MSTEERLPRIALTMGDPAGIGPEMIVKALTHRVLYSLCVPIILGDAGVLNLVRRNNSISSRFNVIQSPDQAEANVINLISLSSIDMESFKYGEPNTDLGMVSTFYILKAAELATDQKVDGLVTSAINKAMLIEAGFDRVSHSEMIQSIAKVKHTAVMLVGERLRLTRVTSHIPLSMVSERISAERVLMAIRATDRILREDFGIPNPKLAVCSLNPHAGDHGLFGKEEIEIIMPAVEKARSDGIDAGDPIPAEKVFRRARDGECDAVICMYHDQAHIAFGLIDSDRKSVV